MERRATRTRTTLAVSMLALTLIAPWALGQDLTETRRLAEQGDADAQYNLGYRYVTGIGVPQDRAEAVRWLRLAADQGHTQAEDFLGRMPPMGSQRATDNVAETELPATLPPATGQAEAQDQVPSLHRPVFRRTNGISGNFFQALYRTRSLGHQTRLCSGRVFRCEPASAQASGAVAPVLFR